MWGGLFFGFFLLAEQKKETRPSGRDPTYKLVSRSVSLFSTDQVESHPWRIAFWSLAGYLCCSAVWADESVLTLAAKGNAVVGAQLSESERCQECHGQDGISHDGKIPNHAGQHAAYLVKQLLAFRSGERRHDIMNRMAEELSDQDIADIAAYFAGQSRMRSEAGLVTPFAVALFSQGDQARGIQPCGKCHGEQGQGKIEQGVVYPRIGGQRRVYLRGQLAGWKLADRTNSPQAVMNDTARQLSDDEIDALADYIAGL